MPVLVYNRFVSILALVALAGVVVLAVPRVRRSLDPELQQTLRWLALAVALTATVGSLIYSEAYGFEPCRLCWYQRIAMYPLVVVLAVGAIRRDRGVAWYGIPLAGIGLLTSAYHYLIQTFPTLDAGACAVGIPCTAKYVNTFGFISIPFMAGAGFAVIIALLTASSQEAT